MLGRHIELDIARWYRGAVRFIVDLRPHTVIKDEAIPALLRQQPQPTFVTINERDFWRKVTIDERYCIVCFAWSDARVREISPSLQSLLRHASLRTKAQRMGKVIRVADADISYYTFNTMEVTRLT